jgi:predicted O-methyltransferase YrrM
MPPVLIHWWQNETRRLDARRTAVRRYETPMHVSTEWSEVGMTDREPWTAVDDYFTDLLVQPDPILDAALQASDDAGLPRISVSPAQGKMLMLLAQMLDARKILEIGTLGGYSTIWLARSLPPDGRLITLEYDPKHADVARANVDRAGLSDKVDIRVGRALDSLPKIAEEGSGSFDLIFVDADKPSNPEYLTWALKLSHRGSLLVFDNVVRGGGIVDPENIDPGQVGTRRLLEMLGQEPRVSATAIQTVGVKGYDGFALAVVTS